MASFDIQVGEKASCLLSETQASKCLLSPDVLFLDFPSEPLANWSLACPIGGAIILKDFLMRSVFD